MAKFAYNNGKNASIGHTPFELNCGYYLCVSFEKDTNSRLQLKIANKLLTKLQKLMTVFQENLYYAQKLQKQAYDKGVKLKSYAPSEKVWLNSKYLKTKQNRKLEAKFFKLFQVVHLVGKQAYKLELPKRYRKHDVFHMSLLEQNTTRKRQIDKKVTELEFEASDSKKYKVEAIQDNAIYANKAESYLSGLYYLVA